VIQKKTKKRTMRKKRKNQIEVAKRKTTRMRKRNLQKNGRPVKVLPSR